MVGVDVTRPRPSPENADRMDAAGDPPIKGKIWIDLYNTGAAVQNSEARRDLRTGFLSPFFASAAQAPLLLPHHLPQSPSRSLAMMSSELDPLGQFGRDA